MYENKVMIDKFLIDIHLNQSYQSVFSEFYYLKLKLTIIRSSWKSNHIANVCHTCNK